MDGALRSERWQSVCLIWTMVARISPGSHFTAFTFLALQRRVEPCCSLFGCTVPGTGMARSEEGELVVILDFPKAKIKVEVVERQQFLDEIRKHQSLSCLWIFPKNLLS